MDVFSLVMQKTSTGTFGGSVHPRVDIPKAVDDCMDGRLPLQKLISKSYALEHAHEAFEDMHAGRITRDIIKISE